MPRSSIPYQPRPLSARQKRRNQQLTPRNQARVIERIKANALRELNRKAKKQEEEDEVARSVADQSSQT